MAIFCGFKKGLVVGGLGMKLVGGIGGGGVVLTGSGVVVTDGLVAMGGSAPL
jgi:hypothetical protein